LKPKQTKEQILFVVLIILRTSIKVFQYRSTVLEFISFSRKNGGIHFIGTPVSR